MGIMEEKRKREEEKEVIASFAQKLYNEQLEDITNIAHTDWYKQIKKYWERVKEWAESELHTIDEKNLKIVQLKRTIADEFLSFLNNLEKAKDTRAKVKS